jgi:hypothetical protein
LWCLIPLAAGRSDLVVPVEKLPENLRKNMGAHWEYSIKNRKILEER